MKHIITTSLTLIFLMLAGAASAGDCMRLCDYNFWQRNGNGVPSLEEIQAEIDKGADPTARGSGKYTPLHWASAYADAKQIIFLLEQGADLKAKTGLHTTRTGKRTPLHYATNLSGDSENVVTLLEAGANVNARDISGHTPLILAAKRQNAKLVNILLDAGANAKLKTYFWKEIAFKHARGKPEWIKHLSTYRRLKAASGE